MVTDPAAVFVFRDMILVVCEDGRQITREINQSFDEDYDDMPEGHGS
jgi:hypothetical protein